MAKHCKRLLFYTLFLVSIGSFAAEYNLFKNGGDLDSSYLALIEKEELLSGDRLIAEAGRVFIFERVLGRGKTTVVLEVIELETNKRMAMRLPAPSQQVTFKSAKRYLNATLEGYAPLVENGIPLVEIYFHQEASYALVELVDVDFDLKTFLTRPESLNKALFPKAEEALIEFAKSSAQYTKIGDFHFEQLIYSSKRNKWILLDWSSGHSLAENENAIILLSPDSFIDIAIRYDSLGHPVYDKTMLGKTMVRRKITEREKRLYRKLREVTKRKRLQILGNNQKSIEKVLDKLRLANSLEDYRSIYDEASKGIQMYPYSHALRENFIDDHVRKYFNLGFSITNYLYIKNKLGFHFEYDHTKLIEQGIMKTNSLSELLSLLLIENIETYDNIYQNRINKAIASHLDFLLDTPYIPKATARELLKMEFLKSAFKRKIARKANVFFKGAKSCFFIMKDSFF